MPSSATTRFTVLSLHDALPILEYSGWNLAYRGVLMMAAGLQMAGPHLTPETFAAGLQKTVFPNPDTPLEEGKVTVRPSATRPPSRSEEHTSELQSRFDLVCRLLRRRDSPSFPYTTLFRSWSTAAGTSPTAAC